MPALALCGAALTKVEGLAAVVLVVPGRSSRAACRAEER
jgi:hypothetical protein